MPNLTPGDSGESLRRRVEFIAHDLNHLAALILGYSSLLLERTPASGPDRRDLKQIHHAAERMASLTRQLQEWRLDRPAPASLVDLNALVRETEILLRGVLGPEIRLRTSLDPALGATRAVPEQIDRVFLNLAINARDAMPAGGEVEIVTANLDLDPVRAVEWQLPPGSYVEIRFRDNGPGMDPLSEPDKGMGLPIVREIARQAGGGVLIRSVPEEGVSISLALPRALETTSSSGAGGTILIVDDEPEFRALVRTLVEGAGFGVLEAENGDQGAAILERGGVQLLLVDILMPQKDGLEVIRLSRKRHTGLKIIAMSGRREDYLGVAKLLGADAVLAKPFSRELLLETIRNLLELG